VHAGVLSAVVQACPLIEQLLKQQQQQQDQQQQTEGSLQQRYCLISLAEGVLLLMQNIWTGWHGKRLVGKLLAPALLPTIKLSLALIATCASSSSSSNKSQRELHSLEQVTLDVCLGWTHIFFSGFPTAVAQDLTGSSSSSVELLVNPALQQLLLLHLAVTAGQLHDQQKGLSPVAVAPAATPPAGQPRQQQQQQQQPRGGWL
jgi:hypothetical protein